MSVTRGETNDNVTKRNDGIPRSEAWRLRNREKTIRDSVMKNMLHKRKNLGVGLLVALILTLSGYFIFEYLSMRPKRVTSFESISLGMSMHEVKYILGRPRDVLYENIEKGGGAKGRAVYLTATAEEIAQSPYGVGDFLYWMYDLDGKRIDVKYDEGTRKVRSIGCYVESSSVDSSSTIRKGTCAINNIEALDAEQTIIKQLGKPSLEEVSDYVKTMQYTDLNMKIYLEKMRTYYIVVEEFGGLKQ